MTNHKFHRLFGQLPRKPETKITQFHADLARSIQEVTEEVMVKMADHIHQLTGSENLCLSGGVALNCVGNGKILQKGKFKRVWIQPAAGDAGSALGVALFIWHKYLNNERKVDSINDSQKGSYLGPVYSNDEIKKFLDSINAQYTYVDQNKFPAVIAGHLSQEKVLGLFYGRMEFGPRALGARSIIADARSDKMQSILNLKIKFRESFRPFAPSVLDIKAKEYFDINEESPYMLLVAPVSKNRIIEQLQEKKSSELLDQLRVRRSDVPAVTHVDYSARVQTVSKKRNPFYYQIIEEFNQLTGCPVIINTSFNVRGEPIVCTPQEAYRCFMTTDMDYLVLGDFILDKKVQPNKEKYKKEDVSLILD